MHPQKFHDSVSDSIWFIVWVSCLDILCSNAKSGEEMLDVVDTYSYIEIFINVMNSNWVTIAHVVMKFLWRKTALGYICGRCRNAWSAEGKENASFSLVMLIRCSHSKILPWTRAAMIAIAQYAMWFVLLPSVRMRFKRCLLHHCLLNFVMLYYPHGRTRLWSITIVFMGKENIKMVTTWCMDLNRICIHLEWTRSNIVSFQEESKLNHSGDSASFERKVNQVYPILVFSTLLSCHAQRHIFPCACDMLCHHSSKHL